MTYKQISQVIAHYQNDLNKVCNIDSEVTWKEVFNYSPSGELFMLTHWYNEAIAMYREFGDNLEGLNNVKN